MAWWCRGISRYHTTSWYWSRVRNKMAAIFQTTFSVAFSWMKMFKFQLRFHWSLLYFVPKGPINNIPSLVQIMGYVLCLPQGKGQPIISISINKCHWLGLAHSLLESPWCKIRIFLILIYNICRKNKLFSNQCLISISIHEIKKSVHFLLSTEIWTRKFILLCTAITVTQCMAQYMTQLKLIYLSCCM